MMTERSNGLVWVTGAGGLMGSYFLSTAARCAPGWRIAGVTRLEVDLTDTAAVARAFQRDAPGCVIHCAALSRSPACQAAPALAWQINVEATRFLAEQAAQIPFVFFSTDLVFDGSQGAYTESDAPNPLSVYAETKAAAEQLVLKNPRHLVIRTSLNGGNSPTGDRGFNEELRLAFQGGRKLRLFTDEFRCPLPALETVRAVWDLLRSGRSGLYHIAGAEKLSRWEIGVLLAERWAELNPRLEPGTILEYQGPRRSPDTSLVCGKAEKVLGRRLPGLAEWLRAHPEEVF